MTAPLGVRDQQRLRLIAPFPGQYSLRAQSSDYRVPADGRVTFDIAMVHHFCSVYLFDSILIGKVPDPYKEQIITITQGSVTVRRLSMHEFQRLSADGTGYHELVMNKTL